MESLARLVSANAPAVLAVVALALATTAMVRCAVLKSRVNEKSQALGTTTRMLRECDVDKGRHEAECCRLRGDLDVCETLLHEAGEKRSGLDAERARLVGALASVNSELGRVRSDSAEAIRNAERLTAECCALRSREDAVTQWMNRGIVMTPEFRAALNAALDPDDCSPIYVSGPAGTGKSVLIGLIQSNLPSGCAVAAPFGLAANNIGGQTIHSLFKFPPAYNPRSGLLSSEIGVKLLKSMKVLVLDEASTLSAHLADAIDATLREGRGVNAPFGGCRLVLVGDLAQLPPVYNGDDLKNNQSAYGLPEPFFFSARVFGETLLRRFRLNHIFRQTSIRFTDTLGRIRTGDHTDEDLVYINLRHTYADLHKPPMQRTTLYPENASVDALNQMCLNNITATPYSFAAKSSGQVTSSQLKHAKYPENLIVKIGARVMLLDNAGQSYSNGTIGTVVGIEPKAEVIQIRTKNGEFGITPSEQKITATSLAGSNLVTKEVGTITQFPLKLAWAITVHKAQGQTFDEVYIDPTGTFSHGQTYAALSRVKEPSGLHLLSPLCSHHVMVNQTLKLDGWL